MVRLTPTALIGAEVILRNEVERRTGVQLVSIVPMRVVPLAARGHLSCAQTEEKEVLLAGLGDHLDRRPVARADSERVVYHEFHVVCPAGFVARGRDPLRKVACWNKPLGERHVANKPRSVTGNGSTTELDRRDNVIEQDSPTDDCAHTTDRASYVLTADHVVSVLDKDKARGFLRSEPDRLIRRAAREEVSAPTQGYPLCREDHDRGRERHFDKERYHRRRKSLPGEIYDFD